jgi:hypothetical protein
MARRQTTEAKLKLRMSKLLLEAKRVGLRFALQVGLPVRPNKRQSITISAVLLEDIIVGAETHACPCCNSPVDIQRMHRSRVWPYVVGWCVACVDSSKEVGVDRTVVIKKSLRRDAGATGRAARIATITACVKMFRARGMHVIVDQFGVSGFLQWKEENDVAIR